MVARNDEHIRMPIRKAAKVVRRDREKIRNLVKDGKVRGFKVGGTEENPWLEVYLDELKRAIDDDEIFIPEPLRSASGNKAARKRAQDKTAMLGRTCIHPGLARMLARGAKHD